MEKLCHSQLSLALPPAVLPPKHWKNLLETHNPRTMYKIKRPLLDPPRILVWRYLSAFSPSPIARRRTNTLCACGNSRYFRALHPQVSYKARSIGTWLTLSSIRLRL
ncbi:diheme cytochrome c [Scytonema sp. UIC 10036]|uniref:diheme cytochrome c n=1 Tax=Scytonema sp. UIC 10036 TaxID=2304196 RepID=UPI001FA983DC|nr:diheme cytochrome c [Scytonema sp. UIC 10036]